MSKNVIITGGSSGIGYAIAKQLLNFGYNIFIVSRNAKKCDLGSFENCHLYNSDLKETGNSFGIVDLIRFEHKINNFDFLINCAGIGYATPLNTLSELDFQHIMDVNVKGLIFMTKAILPFMKRNSVICNISSIAGIKGFKDWSTYCASKYAVEGFSKALREEVRKMGIKVVVVRPGAVDTQLYNFLLEEEKKDFMKPSTIANFVINSLFVEENACVEEIFINNSVGDI